MLGNINTISNHVELMPEVVDVNTHISIVFIIPGRESIRPLNPDLVGMSPFVVLNLVNNTDKVHRFRHTTLGSSTLIKLANNHVTDLWISI